MAIFRTFGRKWDDETKLKSIPYGDTEQQRALAAFNLCGSYAAVNGEMLPN